MDDKKLKSTAFTVQQGAKQYLGSQITLDLYNCSGKVLSDLTHLKKILVEISKYGGFEILSSKYTTDANNIFGTIFIKGKTTGGTIGITTYPEYSFASIDISFSNGLEDTDNTIILLKKGFEARSSKTAYLYRGNFFPKITEKTKTVSVAK